MKLTKDEMAVMIAVLNTVLYEMPYEEVNKHLGDITLEQACDLLAKVSRECRRR